MTVGDEVSLDEVERIVIQTRAMNRQQRRAAKKAHRRSLTQTPLRGMAISDKGEAFTVQTRDGRPFFETSAIFPIFVEEQLGTLELVGTGFYVTRFGHFLTGRHVLTQIHEKQKPGFMFHMLDDEKSALIRNITTSHIIPLRTLPWVHWNIHLDTF